MRLFRPDPQDHEKWSSTIRNECPIVAGTMSGNADVLVIGGGPAGSAIACLLARWGHPVRVLTRAADPARGAAESLPPSSRKLLAKIGVLDAIDRAHFYRTTGNTVWWGQREGHVEKFAAAAGDALEAIPYGYQVLRPELDRLLLATAADAGAEISCDAHVHRVHLAEPDRLEGNGRGADTRVEYHRERQPATSISCRFALDCSGRAGVIARQGFRRHQPGYRTQAFIGVWQSATGWNLPDDTHTLVETYEDGWAWSVPLSATLRQVGVAIDGGTTRIRRGPTLHGTYRAEIAKTRQLGTLMSGATLDRVWACDSSLFSADQYAGSQFLLIGDAASSIDPLSSFGVKKALASAWVGAVAIHTCLTHPDRQPVALEFFSNWERQVYSANLRRSVEFAREAYGRHPHPFWANRAGIDVEAAAEDLDEDTLFRAPDVRLAFERLKASAAIEFAFSERVSFKKRPLIHDREIVLEDALSLPEAPDGIRFLAGVDLLRLGEIACHHRQVPDLFEAYCRTHGAVSLPSLLGSLSVLVAKGVLTARE
jgi:2-polyprenyl-6-methoxyphenol hydroxylase-like FAD-dependent oxidoreductase